MAWICLLAAGCLEMVWVTAMKLSDGFTRVGYSVLTVAAMAASVWLLAQAVKTAVFAARVMELLGYETEPHSSQVRHDIIQMIHMREPEALKKFCKGIQFGAPVDSYVTPEPWDMPGYDCQVIMAAGAFTLGASIELSADAPLREPYAAWMQGGLNFHSGRLGAMLAAQSMLERGILEA